MQHRVFSANVVAMTLLFAMTAPAWASIILYADRTSYEAASSGNTTITFEGLSPDGNEVAVPSPYTTDGVTFTGGWSPNYAASYPPSDYLCYNWGSGQCLFMRTDATITLPANVTAVAFGLGRDSGPVKTEGMYVTLTVGGVDQTPVFVPTFSNPTMALFAATSDDPISKIGVALASFGGGIVTDNFTFGSKVIPEPVSGVLVLLGAMAGLGLRRFRR